MKNKLTALAFISLLALTACGTKKYQPQDYILSMNYKDDFRILQLTDIHLSDKDDQQTQFKFMDLLYKDANNPDLVVVTGDLFTFASKGTAKSLLNYLDGKGIPWTVCFGNHDEQCYFSVDWLTETLTKFGSKGIVNLGKPYDAYHIGQSILLYYEDDGQDAGIIELGDTLHFHHLRIY